MVEAGSECETKGALSLSARPALWSDTAFRMDASVLWVGPDWHGTPQSDLRALRYGTYCVNGITPIRIRVRAAHIFASTNGILSA